jgi:hypothetical protein
MKLNKKNLVVIFILVFIGNVTLFSTRSTTSVEHFNTQAYSAPIIADHTVVNYVRLDMIPDANITNAKNTLHIAYGHTSHGSQVTTGMSGLPAFKEGLGGTEGLYDWNEGGTDGALDIDDYFMSGDLGNPDRTTWAERTREYLVLPANEDVNVVMWSWCGQVSSATEADIITYLILMDTLETDFPGVKFVYMTGHVDGTGLEGNLHIRNEQIREYCLTNNKILFDFADIESYDPDGSYFGDKRCNDNCDYDSDNDTTLDANWAIEWQDAHPGEWYSCSSAHSQPLNANMKAYAAWWLWATLAGWNTTVTPTLPTTNPTPTNTSYPTFPFSLASYLITSIALMAGVIITRILVKKKQT